MKFGTLTSIEKSSSDDNNEFDATRTYSELDNDEMYDQVDTDSDKDPLQAILDKLVDIKIEIDAILNDMGYGSDQEFDDEGFDDEELDDEHFDDEEFDDDELDDDHEFDDEELDDEHEFDDEELDNDEYEFDDSDLEDESASAPTDDEDPNFQGNIRTVAGANLVYKRKEDDGNYEELWIYNVGNDIKKEMQIRRAILAGTDIVPSQTESEDGTQHSETYTIGNVQYLKITGLPN